MWNRGKKAICGLLILFGLSSSVHAELEKNLAFKILEEKAAKYEEGLSENLRRTLAEYIPLSRFFLSVRIYWNPEKYDQIEFKQQPLKKKKGKLPGFNIFVREEERSLDYYLDSTSILKLKVFVLLDQSLSEKYEEFIYRFVPIQARFVPERGDSILINRIPFPKDKSVKGFGRELSKKTEAPFTQDDATATLMKTVDKAKTKMEDYKPVILHPLLQKYVSDYENHITEKLQRIINKYLTYKEFLVNIKFLWNHEQLDRLKNLIMRSDVEGKVKLPGYSIYLEERDQLYEILSSSTSLLKLEVNVLLDEKVQPEMDDFLKKVVPLSFKFIPERGDKLTIYRQKFPEKKAIQATKTESSEDKSEQATSSAKERDFDSAQKDEYDRKKPLPKERDKIIREKIYIQPEQQASRPGFSERGQVYSVRDRIDAAFNNGNYHKGLTIVNQELARTPGGQERVNLLKMKGSLHFMLQQKEEARQSWSEAMNLAPNDPEIEKVLDYLK